MKNKVNKYAAIEMIDLDDKEEDILGLYLGKLFDCDKSVGVVADKLIVEDIVSELIKLECLSVKEIDFIEYVDCNEYLVSVDTDGYITAVPIDYFDVLDDTDICYIDMDGTISQDIIDYCVNEDKTVILFGQKDDDECECKCEKEKSTDIKEYEPTTKRFVNGKEVTKEEYAKAVEEISHFLAFIDKVFSF